MPRHEPIGSGLLVLVAGPSGAGKDTLIAGAREACRDDPRIVFPRRIVTRAASADEDHATVTAAEFERVLAEGGFALWWRAHGLSYALPRSIDADIAAGRTVVCNVSRTVIPPARARYGSVRAVLVTAPVEVLAARLAQRGRESAEAIAERLGRTEALTADWEPDATIENAGAVEPALGQFLSVIREASSP